MPQLIEILYNVDMNTLKIATIGLTPAQIKLYKSSLPQVIIENFETLSELTNPEHYQILSVFIDTTLTASILSQFTNLQAIATRSTGYDHIDIEYTNNAGIAVYNVPQYGDITVAEHTMALIFQCIKRIAYKDQLGEMGLFDKAKHDTTSDMFGLTLGVVGAGSIGSKVIKYAKVFGLEIVVYDITTNNELIKNYDVSYVSLEDLYKKSDIISFHAPHTQETKHMLNMNSLSLFKKGVVVINTARGELIESKALLKGLENETISSAGLDTLEGEHNFNTTISSTATAIINHPRVIYTAHSAYNTLQAIERIHLTTLSNIANHIQDRPENIVC